MRSVAALLMLAAAACSPENAAPDDPAKPQASAVPAANGSSAYDAPAATQITSQREPAELIPARELIGEWRVAGVDGQAIDLPYGITASITGDRIHIVADCINLAWTYAAESGTIETERVPVESCGRGMTTQEEAIVAAIDSATGFGRIPPNAVEIFTTGRRVTLYSQ